MKRKLISLIIFIIINIILSANLLLAQSGREYRRSAVMRGNLVKSVFGNWGVIGQPAERGKRGAWIYDNNGYIGDVSPIVGAEVVLGDTVFHSVVVCPIDRPTREHERSDAGDYWGFEPVAGYFNESQEGISLYSDPLSWPPMWPDKMNDTEDPGWSGYWNGFFGKTTTASEECYFVMNDNNDYEFNVADNNLWNVSFKPDSTDLGRNGLGLEVKVRAMQWSDFLAQDCIFWLYEITNTGTYDYSKVVFGMLVGTLVGTSGANETHGEWDDDYSMFDAELDLVYTADFDNNCHRNPLWTGDVGVVGYAFLESPGNQYDGIDNDGDADANLIIPATGPFFTEEDFEELTYDEGNLVVIIDEDYNRNIVEVPPEITTFYTRGDSITIEPGETELVEGNVVMRDGQEVVNPNAYDGIDNDLDGLIDENYYLHYHQIRKDSQGNILIDKFSPVRYKDYLSGLGVNDFLIDERRDDGIDNDYDWNPDYDDVGADGLIGTNDRGEGDGEPTAGEPNFDQTDVDESDQIGLTSFEYFTPSNDFSMADDEDLWRRLSPGFFEVPASIVNNIPQRGEDGDFTYGSGYFPLRAGETQRFSLALVYGESFDDLLNNRKTVQKIYDSDYRFPPAPEKPTLTVAPGDGQVTLYWDRKAENTFDPVLKVNDFEGYKIYKATDHNFNEVFNITDADGNTIFYEPLVQFDMDNDIEGYFRAGKDLFQQGRGASFYLGDNSGLEHSYVDYDVENGRRYFYAVVAYDRGDAEADIFPKENDKRIDILTTGEVRTFQNTAVAIPNAEVAGYVPPEGSVRISNSSSIGTGEVYYKVVDDRSLTGHKYRLEFLDTSNDGVDNNNNWDITTDDVGSDGLGPDDPDYPGPDPDGTEKNGLPDTGEPNIDSTDPDEYFVPVTTSYSVRDLSGVTEFFSARDTFYVRLTNKHLINGTVVVKNASGTEIPSSMYILDLDNGKIKGNETGDLLYGETYSIFYQYYPIYKSQYMEGNPYQFETLDTDIFDGNRLSFNNKWTIELDTLASGWSDPIRAMDFNFNIIDTEMYTTSGKEHLLGLRHPSDYKIEFSDAIAETSLTVPKYWVEGIPVNFKIFNVTDDRYVDFIFVDQDNNKQLSSLDEIVMAEAGNDTELIYTWDIVFLSDSLYTYGEGDLLDIQLKKPFRSGDVFEFTTATPTVNSKTAKRELDNVKVVPNPYVVATTHELPLPPAITSGRGERKIDFIHLPAGAEVHIFTSRGEHVKTLKHDNDIHDGTVSWNLKSKDNLDIAAGIYFYVVDAPEGTKRGKIAVIK